jgi:CheY-like chemotaxis protein
VIERNARAQAQIIEDILDMSRIVSGKLRLDVQRVDLSAVVEAALETVRPAAEAKGIRVETSLEPDAGPVGGDPGRLQQVAWNLLSNAIKFTPRGGGVSVSLRRGDAGFVELSVSDTGQGIKPEFLPYVFEKFRQGDASAARRHGGLGLGLAIVKSLVELHGGTVRARSAGDGAGATFIVALPVSVFYAQGHSPGGAGATSAARGRPPQAAALFHAADCPSLRGVRALVVDDEPDALSLARRLLEECGSLVTTAASAQAGLDALDRDGADVIVSDIGMPGVDGYEFIRRVRSRGPAKGGDVPAAALTAFARTEDRTRALMAGYQTHVAKPVEPAELIAAVASLVGRTGKGNAE